jgi:hypothetical protein
MSENMKPLTPPGREFLSPDQARINIKGLSKSNTSDTFTSPDGAVSDASRDSTRLADSAADYSHGEPINPEVFDKLASVKDDECVVRYSQRTGAITAATPARIVAQISSEAFMDYDLVSDFFLTFRAYLSTEELLSLLLARLRWAINRLEDDGRIIRIRTFAALRHWILNYFVDDFVVNRKLRVQFCNQINAMYREVRQRTGGGVSDMKILLDLKRCWNGRCSLYWDSTDFVVDTQQEADIVPGGIFGSRDPSLTQLDLILDQESKPMTDTFQNKASASKTCYGLPVAARAPKTHHQPSISIPGAPVSPTSDQSLQPASCSIPARAFKRSPPPEGNARGPYPVSVHLRKHNATPNPPMSIKDSQRRLSNAHKRSCSTSDSIRDRGSTNSLSRPVFLVSPHAGSLIRGNVYPPAAPFVDVIAPESPPSQRSRLTVPAMGMPVTFDGGAKPGSPINPAMKTLMGSIRRALSSKQTGTNSTSSFEEINRSPPSLRGKTSGLPLNMTRSSDTLRDKKSTPTARHHLRIDLLCAAVSQSYQMVQAKASQDSFVNHGLGLSISDIHEGSASQNSLGSRDFSIEAGDVQYILGQDDVAFGLVVADDAEGDDLLNTAGALERGMEGDVPVADFDYTTAGMMSMPLLPNERSADRRDSSLEDRRRSSSVDTALARRSKEQGQIRGAELGKSSNGAGVLSRETKSQHQRYKPNTAGSTSARSQQSQTRQRAMRHAPAPSVDASVNSVSTKGSRPGFESQAPGQTLRRRPGGNLRNIENVHDLAQGLRRQSTGSLTTRSESVGSLLVMGGNRAAGSKQKRPAPQTIQHPVSLMRTHSSQHLRPSFEAAISGFSTIPDDDDCGLEATLLKLEGKYEKASRQITGTTKIANDGEKTPLPDLLPLTDHQYRSRDQPSQSKPAQLPVSSRPSHPRLRQPSSFSRTRKPGPTSISTRSGRSKGSAARSEESYSSIPLLERGLVDDSMKEKQHLPRSNLTTSISRPVLEDQANVNTEQDLASPHPSIELVEKTESMGRIPQGGTFPDPQPAPADDSFLLDEDDNLTDLSSEMSVDLIDHSEAENPVISSPTAAAGTTNLDHELLTHPLAHPPSPAVSFHQAITPVLPIHPMMYQQKPLTPQPSPTQGVMSEGSQVSLSQILPRRKSAAVASATVTTSAGHIPFVLACESLVLAQQLTLVEKAALSEIEWSDLVDMKWDNKSPNILNWVEYLAGKDNKGIDIVITRFNIVVKWVVSEIVMTQNIHERAQAITKYIHIAVHAKQLHNYATMLQITIALTSVDCSRLKATWELVPDLEQARLKELETLIQPIRNFHDLRIEMETANLQDGCIPFVGMQNVLTLTGLTDDMSRHLYS